jgi:hypothetical protein
MTATIFLAEFGANDDDHSGTGAKTKSPGICIHHPAAKS